MSQNLPPRELSECVPAGSQVYLLVRENPFGRDSIHFYLRSSSPDFRANLVYGRVARDERGHYSATIAPESANGAPVSFKRKADAERTVDEKIKQFALRNGWLLDEKVRVEE